MQPNGASPKESGSGASGPFSEEVTPENDLRAFPWVHLLTLQTLQ